MYTKYWQCVHLQRRSPSLFLTLPQLDNAEKTSVSEVAFKKCCCCGCSVLLDLRFLLSCVRFICKYLRTDNLRRTILRLASREILKSATDVSSLCHVPTSFFGVGFFRILFLKLSSLGFSWNLFYIWHTMRTPSCARVCFGFVLIKAASLFRLNRRPIRLLCVIKRLCVCLFMWLWIHQIWHCSSTFGLFCIPFRAIEFCLRSKRSLNVFFKNFCFAFLMLSSPLFEPLKAFLP